MAFCLRWADSGRWPSFGSMAPRSLISSSSRSMPLDEPGDGLGAHAALEVVAVAVAQLAPQQLVLDDLAAVQVAELVEGPLHELELGVGPLADVGDVALGQASGGP